MYVQSVGKLDFTERLRERGKRHKKQKKPNKITWKNNTIFQVVTIFCAKSEPKIKKMIKVRKKKESSGRGREVTESKGRGQRTV